VVRRSGGYSAGRIALQLVILVGVIVGFAVIAGWSVVLVAEGAPVAAFVVFALVDTIRFARQRRVVHARMFYAHNTLARGELRAAREVYERLLGWVTHRELVVHVRHMYAWTAMRQGELQYATDLLNESKTSYAVELRRQTLSGMTAAVLALNYSLLGDLAKAERCVTEAERCVDSLNPQFPALKALSRAALDCRAGRYGPAARLLAEQSLQIEDLFSEPYVRLLLVVRAFATAMMNDAGDAGPAAAQLDAARPKYPGEYDFLGLPWPEMATFLASHALARPA
jgi:hypothetical protein